MRLNIMRIFSGSVLVECSGGFFERFIERAVRAGLEPYNIRHSGSFAELRLPAPDYRALRAHARASQVRIRLKAKRGLPFFLRRFKNLLPLAAGMALMLGVIWGLGSLVLDIELAGSSTAPKSEIMESLKRSGLEEGCLRSGVDVLRVEQLLMLDNERLAWATVNLGFGRATVELRDKLDETASAAAEGGMLLVAKRDAQIRRIVLTGGEPLVEAGDVVAAGQTIVAPSQLALPGSWTAGVSARVWGRTSYSETFETGRRHIRRERTRESLCSYTLCFKESRLELPSRDCSWRWYDELRYSRPLTVFGFELPISIETREYIRVEQKSELLTPQHAAIVLEEMKREFERQTLAEAEIVWQESELIETERGFALKASYICEEEIGEYVWASP
ncbi:MAG: sporulation protein YqfD [Oscillospiraceae bacterium]|nr:sporulation protein YqfD [Oscillospiraceae bacterium]